MFTLRRVKFLMLISLCKISFVSAEIYQLEVSVGEYKIIERKDGLQEINLPDWGNLLIPGAPMLPAKVLIIAVPPGAKVTSVKAQLGARSEVKGSYKIAPAPMQLMKSIHNKELIEQRQREYGDTYNRVYGSDEPYPTVGWENKGVGNLSKWRIVKVWICPFEYRPKSEKLVCYSDIRVTISYELPAKMSEEWKEAQKWLRHTGMDDLAKKVILNYEEAKEWYKVEESEPNSIPERIKKVFGEDSKGSSYFIIIPDDSYLSSVFPLVWKDTVFSDTTRVTTIEKIEDRWEGQDRQEKIRNCLKEVVPSYNVKYVLLVGDVGDIPFRDCWPDSNNHTPDEMERPVPTDHYYADLSGDWDSDGDGYFGEMGQDNVDFFPEVKVGRIIWSDSIVVRHICKKIVSFEQDIGAWKKRALLLGSVTFCTPQYTDEADIMEQIKDTILIPKGWSYTTLYEKAGLDPSMWPCDDSLCVENVTRLWSTSQYGFVNWSAHGSRIGAYRTIWVEDRNNNSVADDDEKAAPVIFDTGYVGNLNDSYPSIVYSSACLTSYPETYSLGQILQLHGAVGYIGGTRVIWGPPGNPLSWYAGGNTGFNYLFVKEMNAPLRLGDALYSAKMEYYTRFTSHWMDFLNLYALNLYGDPALIWWGYVGAEEVATQLPRNFILLQNIPNPSIGQTTISYYLPAKSWVAIKIYDTSGRLVRTLVNKEHQPGHYSLQWDGKNDYEKKVVSGIYFYRMEAGEFVATKKLMILR